ncbi:hypothetical protein HORM4_260023 [Vibrio harveyi]|nr:hypothetical protein HORM4_260023 [Vibrio harveyi]
MSIPLLLYHIKSCTKISYVQDRLIMKSCTKIFLYNFVSEQ